MRPPEFAPGALARQRQARERNRTSPNFPPTQAPSGAGRDRTQALLILRAGNVLPTSRDNPVTGSGESGPMDLGGAKRSRSPSDASPAILWFLSIAGKETRRPQAAKLPLRGMKPLYHRPLIRHGFAVPPSPQGEGFWGKSRPTGSAVSPGPGRTPRAGTEEAQRRRR